MDSLLEQNENSERLRMILESVPDSLVFVNSEGRIVMVNDQTETLFGYSRKELLGREIEILIPERFRTGHHERVMNYFKNPRPRVLGVGLELFGLTKKGREFPVDISLSPIETDSGMFVIADIRDITERKMAEEKIRTGYHYQRTINSILKVSLKPVPLSRQLEAILDIILNIPSLAGNAMGSIYLAEDDQKTLVMKAQKYLPESLVMSCAKVPFGDCLCGLGASTHNIVFASGIKERNKITCRDDFPHGHYCVPILSGEKILGVLNIYIKNGYRHSAEEEDLLHSVSNTIAGVIERKRTEIEKEALQEQLVQSEKMSALGRVTANVAHDIRNPLTIIGGYVRRLRRAIPEGTKEKGYTDIIINEVDRLEKILRNVLTYSSRSSVKKAPGDINDIINSFLKTYEYLCRENSVEIVKQLDRLPPVMIDEDLVSEAINNLLSNAVDAMPRGGTLTVTTARELYENADCISVRISDTGEGISDEDRKMVFEPFYSTKVAGHGAGLGLSICKKIMEDHNGFINVESMAGKGSSFTLYFPLDG